MTSEPPRPAPPAPEVVAQALALVLKAMEDSEPAGDLDGQDIESNMTHLDRLAWRRQVAAEAFQLTAQTEAALFRRRRNALLPIHRLPSELLSAILIKSVDVRRAYRTELLHELAQVAWQWWQTIKSDPRFWAHITFPMESVELHIRRAGNLPLRLDWPSSVDAEDPDTFKDLLQRHAERWTSVDLKSYKEDVTLQVLCTNPFPRLEYLKFHRECPTIGGIWKFDLAKFPNLQEAHLPIVPSFSDSPTSHSPLLLQALHLDLHSMAWDSPSSYNLESLLRYTPQLETLSVGNLDENTSLPSSIDTPIIDLPMLRHLRFSTVFSRRRRDEIPLLAQIRAPLLETFDLRYSDTRWDSVLSIGGRTIFHSLVTRTHALLSQPENGPLFSVLRNAGPSASWRVRVSGNDVFIMAKGSGPEGQVDIHCSAEDDIPRYILQPLAMFTLPVDLDLGWWDEDPKLAFWEEDTKPAVWEDALNVTPLLRSFTLDCTLQVAQQVTDRLSTKAPSPSSTNPRAPLLERVHFQNEMSDEHPWSEGDVGEAVKTMLESRRNLFIQGGVLDPPKLVVTGPHGLVFDEVEGRWLESNNAQSQS